MARFYRLQLETIYFTSNGLASGIPARLVLEGVDGLNTNVEVTQTDRQNDGSVLLQTIESNKKGVELVARLTGSLKNTTFDALAGLIGDSLESGETLTLVGTGEPVDFSAQVVAFPPATAGFSGDRIKGAVFRFITV